MFQTKEVSFQVYHTAGQMGQAGQAAEIENLLNGSSLPVGPGSQKEIPNANMQPGIPPEGDVITILCLK